MNGWRTDRARRFLESIMDEADRSGGHYAPCFRDCLGDNIEWVTERLVQLLAEHEEETGK